MSDIKHSPLARGPLLDVYRRLGATIELIDGWQVAVRCPESNWRPPNMLVDLSHFPTFEINGSGVGTTLIGLCGTDVPLRTIRCDCASQIYRLTPNRPLVFGTLSSGRDSLDVTGGWAALALTGPDAARSLDKLPA